MNWQRTRFEEKRDFVIHWLLEFHTSTRKTLSAALGVNNSNQNNFFNSLIKSGLFERVKHPLLKEQLWMLNYQGKQFAAFLSLKAEKYHASPSRVITTKTIHNLSIQRAILVIKGGKGNFPFDFKSEKMIPFIEKHKRPDAILDIEGEAAALEVELTLKSHSRIYLAFTDHIQSMKENLYDHVYYVFPTQKLCDKYKLLFEKKKWPIFYRDKQGKVRAQMEGGKQVKSRADSDAIRNRFDFEYLKELNP